jgi:hypothetical protein
VFALEVFDDGNGEKIWIGGAFTTIDGVEAGRIATWDGQSVQPTDLALNGTVYALKTIADELGDSLYIGGDFTVLTRDGINYARERLARLRAGTPDEPCPADVNGSGSVDLADLNLVLANFGQASSSGDVNGDGQVNLADLNAVLAAFGTMCS